MYFELLDMRPPSIVDGFRIRPRHHRGYTDWPLCFLLWRPAHQNASVFYSSRLSFPSSAAQVACSGGCEEPGTARLAIRELVGAESPTSWMTERL